MSGSRCQNLHLRNRNSNGPIFSFPAFHNPANFPA
jgi:hypothetical protein